VIAPRPPGRLSPADLVEVLAEGVRPVWPGYYATAAGQVLSVQRPPSGRILAPSSHHRTGHLRVKLYRPTGRREAIDVYVHRIVCLAWHGPPPLVALGLDATVGDDLLDALGVHVDALVLHGDHDPTNNAPANLAWGTHDENTVDRTARGAVEAEANLGAGLFGGDDIAAHRAVQAYAGRLGVYLPDPVWGF